MSNKTIMVVGGGSGGHLTPLIAVATELKKSNNIAIAYIGQKNENLQEVLDNSAIDSVHEVSAGKFRRYYGESLVSHLLDVKTLILNVRDLFRMVRGVFGAYFLLGRISPDSIFLKGGFVCVPVGIAARLRRVPYITHDSDSIPGLANRITSAHAKFNTTAMDTSLYPYSTDKSVQVGIPIQAEFVKVTEVIKAAARKSLSIPQKAKVILVTGGGLGAQKLNLAVIGASEKLLSDENVQIIHITGKKLFEEAREGYNSSLSTDKQGRVTVVGFTTSFYEYSAAADLIICRAGATNIAEFAIQAKPCVVVPNPVLTGGQQTHNANALNSAKAAYILEEKDLERITSVTQELLGDKSLLETYANNINKLAVNDAASKIAKILKDLATKE